MVSKVELTATTTMNK